MKDMPYRIMLLIGLVGAALSCSAPPAPPTVDQVPSADAGPFQTIRLGQEVTLDGSASQTASASGLNYRWSAARSNPAIVELLPIPRLTFVPPLPGEYWFWLEVSDDRYTSSADSVKIAVLAPANLTPIALAGPDMIVQRNTEVHLDGSASHDPEETPLRFSWEIVEAPQADGLTLAATDSAQTSFTATVSGQYRIRLLVDDGLTQAIDELLVIVEAPLGSPPVADAGPDQQVSPGQEVVLSGNATSELLPTGELIVQWTVLSTPDPGLVLSDATGLSPQFLPTLPGEYLFALIVDDGQNPSAQDLVQITVLAEEQPPLEEDNQPPLEEELPDDPIVAGPPAAMIEIPAGPFTMGSDESAEDEGPAHSIELSGFWIDTFEVSAAAFAQCVEAGACAPPGSGGQCNETNAEKADHPINCVNWDQAEAYCRWADKRLPSEAEWEKAARGDDQRPFPWGDAFPHPTLLNYNNEIGSTSTAGTFADGVSFYGVHNMAGNVAEWTADYYSPTYYAESPSQDPAGPETGDFRTVRGGSWKIGVPVAALSTTVRGRFTPETSDETLGFRCARNTAP